MVLSPDALGSFALLLSRPVGDAGEYIELPRAGELFRVVEDFLRMHFQRFQGLRSLEVLRTLDAEQRPGWPNPPHDFPGGTHEHKRFRTVRRQDDPAVERCRRGRNHARAVRSIRPIDGPLTATAKGEMISAVTSVKGSAAYSAIERVDGSLDGRRGTFVLQHTGVMDRGAPSLVITVVPDPGTGELAGLSGTMRIPIRTPESTRTSSSTG